MITKTLNLAKLDHESLALQQLQSQLGTLVYRLRGNKEIYDNLQELIGNARELSETYRMAMQNEGRQVLTKRAELLVQCNPSLVDVEGLKFSIKSLLERLVFIRDEMFVLQGKVHRRIEECRECIKTHALTISQKNIEVDRLKVKSRDLDRSISDCELEAWFQDQRADEQSQMARTLEERADRHKVAGVAGSGVMLGVGLLFAPFTGGLSLAIGGGAAVGNLGGHVICSLDCEKTAASHRESARSKRNEATRFREQKNQLRKSQNSIEVDIQNLERLKANMSEEADTLRKVEDQLRQAIIVMSTKITQFQDLEQTLTAAEHEGDAFKIIKNAFVKNPEKMEGRAQVYLEKLKEKWRCVESELCLNTGYSIQY